MIATDMHIHSCFSSDSTENPEIIIQTAIQKGFSYIYITDHHDIDFPIHPSAPDMDFQLNFPNYITKLSQLKEAYKQEIDVRIGVELGICPEIADKTKTVIHPYPFDFIIGSSHLTALQNGDPYYPEYYLGKTAIQAYREYFESEAENIRLTDSFDVYGHLDYAVRYCPDKGFQYNFDDYRDIFEVILKRLIEKGKGIEINTSGLTKIGAVHPHMEALKLYKALGGEIITIGSDAHRASDIGYGFDMAEDLLKSLGFKYYTVFKERIPEFVRL